MKQNLAFTLIELLIVVAIIAILAAIALPNFLEAQVRAKVSRVKSDIRTVGLAMEAYQVDNNCYLWNYALKEHAPGPGVFGNWWFWVEFDDGTIDGSWGVKLTSPVSYISSFPIDPFVSRSYQGYTAWWPHGRPTQTSVIHFACPPGTAWPEHFWGVAGVPAIYNDVSYALESTGPMCQLAGGSNVTEIYDPTNGTVSGGQIWYLGRGLGFITQGWWPPNS